MSSKDISNVYKYYNMVPAIARNTIVLTGSFFIYTVYDFCKLMNSYKKKNP